MKKYSIISITLLFISIMVISTNAEEFFDKARLVGYWVTDDNSSSKAELELNLDGTYKLWEYKDNGDVDSSSGTFFVGKMGDSDTLVCTPDTGGSSKAFGIDRGMEEHPEDDNLITLTEASIGDFHKATEEQEEKGNKTIKFRDFEWGASHDEVINKEVTEANLDSTSYGETENRLIIMDSSVAGYDAATYFDFSDGKLISGGYLLKEDHSNLTQYYYDYKSLVEKYTSVYGEPSDVNEVWYDDLYKDDPSDWGMSFATGKSAFSTEWQDHDGNKANIMISGDNYEISIFISYKSGGYTLEENVEGI